jgi:hypothetical protein
VQEGVVMWNRIPWWMRFYVVLLGGRKRRSAHY